MKVIEALNKGKPTLSFEFFPPKTEEKEKHLFEVISELKKFKPNFVSITCGALGTKRDKTVEWAINIRAFGLEPVVHLTLTSFMDKKEIGDLTLNLIGAEIENVLALRGDAPEDQSDLFKKGPWANSHAKDLIDNLKTLYKINNKEICLGVAGYPEKHPEARTMEEDIKHLKEKVDAGADYIVTQLFFDNKHFYAFKEKCLKAGIKAPIIPGIMPITSLKQVKKITKICGASIPAQLEKQLEEHNEDKEAVKQIGIEQAVLQCQELLKVGVPGLHFFVMNQSGPISRILKQLTSFRRQ